MLPRSDHPANKFIANRILATFLQSDYKPPVQRNIDKIRNGYCCQFSMNLFHRSSCNLIAYKLNNLISLCFFLVTSMNSFHFTNHSSSCVTLKSIPNLFLISSAIFGRLKFPENRLPMAIQSWFDRAFKLILRRNESFIILFSFQIIAALTRDA